MIKKFLFFISFFVIVNGYSQLTPITKNTRVSVLTVGTADESHSLYGHTALRIKDTTTDFDFIYNYGMFDFQTENFVLKFVKGDMQYFAAAYPYSDFEYSYRIENRSIFEQVLNLSLEEKQKLFQKLGASLNPDSKYYTYKFIDRNCTTKIVDVLNEVLQNQPIVKKNIDTSSYRDVLYPYAKDHFYQKLGINIIFGSKVDQQATKIFLPFDLYENLKYTTYRGKPLVTESKTLFKANRVRPPFSILDSMYSLIGILILFAILYRKKCTLFFFGFLGILGLFFIWAGFYSFHEELLWNYNVLLFNPLYLFLIYFIVKNNTKWSKITGILCIALLVIYLLYILKKAHLLVVLPIIMTSGFLLIKLIWNKSNLLSAVK
ncbi:lipoprotein N-acyltransferase Lnb domain-containing protein [Flavobacterium luteum]|uniref:DUF4105 domain-containing protein n=1 Tax=Flavobacterium luteum TaxID=2026654 RepID=A0A7J5AG38_9FLAO|nr:DUF4105 domain-containing protein [Flavobacterium luteum]KAB1156552.1 DUF4105 domain-containing protein [Flavobacterium luteum]